MVIKCKDIFELFSDYLDEELESDLFTEIEEHLGECEHCISFFHTYQRTVTLCQSIEIVEVPGKVHIKLWRTLRKEIKK
ncbi:MAG TPA: hypothetical protein DHV62_03755 [Elusimicrobia bacterium]|jgi:predicted anti-sigma-YlaC factor YlaD|nr:hypothetical protein [Elusimicrobiota bacterium]